MNEIEKWKAKKRQDKKELKALLGDDTSLLEQLGKMNVKSAENTPHKEKMVPKMRLNSPM